MPYDGAGWEEKDLLLPKIDEVMDALSDEGAWLQGGWKSPGGTRQCLENVLRNFGYFNELRLPILGAAQEVTGHYYADIPTFNDASATSFWVLRDVLERTRRNIANGTVMLPAPPPVNMWRKICRATSTAGFGAFLYLVAFSFRSA